MKEDKEKFPFEERVIADEVADEILTVDDDKDEKRYFFLILFFLICLIFLVSSISFAVFNTYSNGGSKNLVDVGVNVTVDEKKPNNKDNDKNDNRGKVNKPSTGANDNKPSSKPSINPAISSVFFSFNEKSNYINMSNVYPTKDSVGMKLTGDKEYFDFNVNAGVKNKKGVIVYEISLVPVGNNTIKPSDVRVYLTENGKDVSILDKNVNNFSDLPNSDYRNGAKVIYKKRVSRSFSGNYVFRMWLSSNAEVSSKTLRFGCKIVVDAHYE